IKDVGGSMTKLEYESNSFYKTPENVNERVGGLRVKKLIQKVFGDDPIETSYVYNDENGHSTGQILSKSYANLVVLWSRGAARVFSEAPSLIYDLNGNFSGYSTVKVLNANGGYTTTSYTNFSDFPDEMTLDNGADPNSIPNIISSTSNSFKRG